MCRSCVLPLLSGGHSTAAAISGGRGGDRRDGRRYQESGHSGRAHQARQRRLDHGDQGLSTVSCRLLLMLSRSKPSPSNWRSSSCGGLMNQESEGLHYLASLCETRTIRLGWGGAVGARSGFGMRSALT